MRNMHFLAAATIFLAACASSGVVQMMPRDSGQVYAGTVQGSSSGSGTMTITIDGEVFTGPIVRTSSDAGFGFIQQYGRGGSSFGTVVSGGSNANVKGILSSPNGHGLRCEFISSGDSGGGICVDDKSRVFDAVVAR
jgi:hypothetical protein